MFLFDLNNEILVKRSFSRADCAWWKEMNDTLLIPHGFKGTIVDKCLQKGSNAYEVYVEDLGQYYWIGETQMKLAESTGSQWWE